MDFVAAVAEHDGSKRRAVETEPDSDGAVRMQVHEGASAPRPYDEVVFDVPSAPAPAAAVAETRSDAQELLQRFNAVRQGLRDVAADPNARYNRVVQQGNSQVNGRTGIALVTEVNDAGSVRYTRIVVLALADASDADAEAFRLFTYRPVKKSKTKVSTNEYLEPVGGAGEAGAVYRVPWGTSLSIKEFSGIGTKLDPRFRGELIEFRGLRYEISRYEKKELGKPEDAEPTKVVGLSVRAYMNTMRTKAEAYLRSIVATNPELEPFKLFDRVIDKDHALHEMKRLFGDVYPLPEKYTLTTKIVAFAVEPARETRKRILRGEKDFTVVNFEAFIDERGYVYQKEAIGDAPAGEPMRVVSGTHGNWDAKKCRPVTFQVTSGNRSALLASCIWPESAELFQTVSVPQWKMFGRTFIENCEGCLFGQVGMNLTDRDKVTDEVDVVERLTDGTYVGRLSLVPYLEKIVPQIGLAVPPAHVSTVLEEHLEVRMIKNAAGQREASTNGNLRVQQVIVHEQPADRPKVETVHTPGETCAHISTLVGNIRRLEERLKDDKNTDVQLYVVYPHVVHVSAGDNNEVVEDRLDMDAIRQLPTFEEQLAAVKNPKYYPQLKDVSPAEYPSMVFIVTNGRPVSAYIDQQL